MVDKFGDQALNKAIWAVGPEMLSLDQMCLRFHQTYPECFTGYTKIPSFAWTPYRKVQWPMFFPTWQSLTAGILRQVPHPGTWSSPFLQRWRLLDGWIGLVSHLPKRPVPSRATWAGWGVKLNSIVANLRGRTKNDTSWETLRRRDWQAILDPTRNFCIGPGLVGWAMVGKLCH